MKRSKKSRKNTNSRSFYKSEHIELLKQTYEKSAKYPSKEEISELAKIIGVLPIKVVWWFGHRRQEERKKGDKFSKTVKNETLEKLGSTNETELNSNNVILRTECGNCKQLVTTKLLDCHQRSCKVYWKFLRKSSNGYECTLCSRCNFKYRKHTYLHLRKVHGITNVSEENLEKKENCMEKIDAKVHAEFVENPKPGVDTPTIAPTISPTPLPTQ